MPKHEKPFHLDMNFDEALRRYAQTDPRKLPAPKKKPAKKRKRPSEKHPPPMPATTHNAPEG